MKRSLLLIVLAITTLWLACPVITIGQVTSGGVRARYPFLVHPGQIGGPGYEMERPGEWVHVPDKLPVPRNAEWIKKLRSVWVSENKNLAQFEADQEKFNAFMPYIMVIPQTDRHIRWIEDLFKAYGLALDEKLSLVGPANTLTEAYEKSIARENELLPQYEWLVKNAEDLDSAHVLDTILIRSRIHYVLFEHALRMGPGYAFSMRGITGLDYGYGFNFDIGPGMTQFKRVRLSSLGKSVTAKEAESMVRSYLKFSRNPNLQVGKVRDAGAAFEIDIVTMGDALVDKILVDKSTGWMRSAY